MSIATTTTIRVDNSTSAIFRAWGLAISTKLAAAGLVKTADTSQINWTTVIAPATTSVISGYEMWRFADTLQATAPVFIKLQYGSSAAGAGIGCITITLGSGSDGAGNLTGVLSTPQMIQTASAHPSAYPVVWCGDTGRFAMAVNGGNASYAFMWSIERTKSSAGADTAEGVLMIVAYPSGYLQVAWNCVTGMCSTWESSLGAMGPSVAPFGTSGTQVSVYPVFHSKGVFLNPGLNILAYVDATIGAGSTISFSIYGATHVFMPLGTSNYAATMARMSNASSIMMRYE